MSNQYEIKTAYVVHGERIYYVTAESGEEAQASFEKQHTYENLVRDNVFMMEEHVKDVHIMDTEIDLMELKEAERKLEAKAWNTQMDEILRKSRNKLKDEMGYGEKD